MSVKRICVWSGPRNVSTALMYAFAQRSDTVVVDEPLYAHYLTVSGAPHPGRELVMEAQDTDGTKVVRDVIMGPCDRPVRFVKSMAHHLVDLDLEFLSSTTNVILTRDPVEMLPSLVALIPSPDLRDTGLRIQWDLYSELCDRGQQPTVLDSRLLLLDPEGVLTELCSRVGLPFDPAMLKWKPGARPEDGVWAPLWYQNVHRSSGFAPYQRKTSPFPEFLNPLLEECSPYFDLLSSQAIRSTNESRTA